MCEGKSRYQAITCGVWERAYGDYAVWPQADHDAVRSAVSVLFTALHECHAESELHRRYWQIGDPLGRVLRPQLPPAFDDERLLTLEEACLWLRLRELRGEAP